MQLAGVPFTQASTGASDDTASTAGSTLSGSSSSSTSGISTLSGDTKPKAEQVANLVFNPATDKLLLDWATKVYAEST
jgi:citrate synthase